MALITSVHVSTLSTIASKAILSSPGLPGLIELNAKRLVEAYINITTFFEGYDIAYIPCNSAGFVLARLAPRAKSQPEEMAAFQRYVQAGVLVAPGWAYHIHENQRGWMRVSFSVAPQSLQEGLERIKIVYDEMGATC